MQFSVYQDMEKRENRLPDDECNSMVIDEVQPNRDRKAGSARHYPFLAFWPTPTPVPAPPGRYLARPARP
jgi:hypothetical protein